MLRNVFLNAVPLPSSEIADSSKTASVASADPMIDKHRLFL